jgi:hypothetical protein
MGKDRLPHAQLEFMKEIGYNHRVKVETMLSEADRKCVLNVQLAPFPQINSKGIDGREWVSEI